MLSPSLLTLLQTTDTPTIANAIELAQGKRGYPHFTRGNVQAMHHTAQVACGFARTAQIAAEHPTQRTPEDNQHIRMHYYQYMAEASMPAIAVIEDIDPEPVGAFWGEVNTTIHRGFGLSGTLTNGVMRDLGSCPPDYQVIAGSIGVSHRFVHVITTHITVNVFGLSIAPNDFIHADRHGAVIIPPDLLPHMAHWIEKMQAIEALVLEPAQQQHFDFETFKKAWQQVEQQRV